MSKQSECGVQVWRDGKRLPDYTPPKPTIEEIFKDQNMRNHPHKCPPILHGEAKDLLGDIAKFRRTHESEELTDSDAIPASATLVAGQNIAAYISTAIRDAGSEIAEALHRLARAIENVTPEKEPPTIVRLKDVAQRIGVSSDSVMRLSLKGEFPKPFYLDGIPFFKESDVNDWLAARAA